MNGAIKDIFDPLFEAMLKGEMNHHVGYDSNDKGSKKNENRRNGFGTKTLNTTHGEVDIEVPIDRDATFEPVSVPKRQRDISQIENKVLAIYVRGMSQRDISSTIEDIYGCKVSHEMISDITDAVLPEVEEWRNRALKKCYAFVFVDCLYVTLRKDYETVSHEMISDITDAVLPEVEEWRNRALKKCYAFVFVDCLYVTLRKDYETKECAVYVLLGYDLQGKKEILGIWISERESKNYWMQIFDESRLVEWKTYSLFPWMEYPD